MHMDILTLMTKKRNGSSLNWALFCRCLVLGLSICLFWSPHFCPLVFKLRFSKDEHYYFSPRYVTLVDDQFLCKKLSTRCENISLNFLRFPLKACTQALTYVTHRRFSGGCLPRQNEWHNQQPRFCKDSSQLFLYPRNSNLILMLYKPFKHWFCQNEQDNIIFSSVGMGNLG